MKFNPTYYPIVIFATLALGIFIGANLNFSSQNQFLGKNSSKNNTSFCGGGGKNLNRERNSNLNVE